MYSPPAHSLSFPSPRPNPTPLSAQPAPFPARLVPENRVPENGFIKRKLQKMDFSMGWLWLPISQGKLKSVLGCKEERVPAEQMQLTPGPRPQAHFMSHPKVLNFGMYSLRAPAHFSFLPPYFSLEKVYFPYRNYHKILIFIAQL